MKHDQEGGLPDKVDAEIAVEDTSHKPVEFPGAIFHGSPFQVATLHNEGSSISAYFSDGDICCGADSGFNE